MYICVCIPWKFRGIEVLHFLHVCETFLYESSRWHCSNMDLRPSTYMGFCKSFLWRSMCTTCRETFLPWNFHGMWYITCLKQSDVIIPNIAVSCYWWLHYYWVPSHIYIHKNCYSTKFIQLQVTLCAITCLRYVHCFFDPSMQDI